MGLERLEALPHKHATVSIRALFNPSVSSIPRFAGLSGAEPFSPPAEPCRFGSAATGGSLPSQIDEHAPGMAADVSPQPPGCSNWRLSIVHVDERAPGMA